jgi:hypothetical protein
MFPVTINRLTEFLLEILNIERSCKVLGEDGRIILKIII